MQKQWIKPKNKTGIKNDTILKDLPGHSTEKKGLKNRGKRGPGRGGPNLTQNRKARRLMDLAETTQSHEDALDLLPTAEQLGLLEIGQYVRLSLQDGARFWCRVIEVRNSGYVGQACDTLPGCPVKIGDRCFFERSHVFGIV